MTNIKQRTFNSEHFQLQCGKVKGYLDEALPGPRPWPCAPEGRERFHQQFQKQQRRRTRLHGQPGGSQPLVNLRTQRVASTQADHELNRNQRLQ